VAIEITAVIVDHQTGVGVPGLHIKAWDRPRTLAHQSDVVARTHQHFFTVGWEMEQKALLFVGPLPSAGERVRLEEPYHEFIPERDDKNDDRRGDAGRKGGVHG
jgi:hypothetical protein